MDNTTLVYMTYSNKSEAVAIGNEIVKHRLAACVNIIDQVNSIYYWDGELQFDAEVVMFAKTLSSKVPELMEIVKANHSAECPCILCLPTTGGNPAFLKWISDKVSKD